MLDRRFRPEHCDTTVAKYLQNLRPSDKIQVVTEITKLRGLVGRSSFAAKAAQRKALRDFVKLNRAPTGRTADQTERTHGAKYYLDSRWKVLVSSSSTAFPEDLPFFFAS